MRRRVFSCMGTKHLGILNWWSPNLRKTFWFHNTKHYSSFNNIDSIKNNNNSSNNNYIFTPNNFSFNELSKSCHENIKSLTPHILNIDFRSTINHIRTFQSYDSNFLPNSGSLIHFKINDSNMNNFGIILNDLSFSLSKATTFKVLLPDGRIIKIFHDQILFTIPKFIKYEVMQRLINGDDNEINTKSGHLAQLTYTLNVFLLFFIKITNSIVSKDLIRTVYLKNSFINYQSSLNLENFSLTLYNESKSIRNLLDIKINPFSTHILLFSCHFLIFDDPIHFRLTNYKTSINNVLNPLTQLSTRYFNNPIILSQNLENLFNQPNDLIIKSYSEILQKSNNFQIFNILKSDENFKRLILLIKYCIVYPNEKLLNKLSNVLPINEPLNSKNLFNFLKIIGIYDDNTNPILASGIYGLNDLNDLSLSIKNVNQLQYSQNRGVPNENLPKYLQRYKPLKLINEVKEKELKDKFTNRNYSDLFIKMIKDSRSKIWPGLKSLNGNNKKSKKLYKLTNTIGFSVNQISLTNYQFNIFLPIPDQSPNENITIQEPIQLNDNLKSFPKLHNFNNALRINQPCIKLSFNHNLIDSASLTSPNIRIGLDIFKKIEDIDNEWFLSRSPLHLKGSKTKLDCWLALNKLSNLLIEKEKSRIRLGYLKTFGKYNESRVNLLNFRKFFNDNNNTETVNSFINEDGDDSENFILRDKDWMIENLKLLIDENLSRFCNEKGINIINRNMNKGISNSVDYRIFKKFKIFKWYANSYETFNFQLSSNPGDLTAFVGCLAFLNNFKIFINFGNKRKNNIERGYLPLGLKEFSSFTALNFIESHLNQWQLFRYLIIETFEVLKFKSDDWDPHLLDKVTFEHFNKCLSQSEGYIELINRLNRYEILKKIKLENERISDGTDSEISNNNEEELTLMRCIITKITNEKVIGYWFEMDTEVEIEIENSNSFKNITIGDRLICSKIKKIDLLNDNVILG